MFTIYADYTSYISFEDIIYITIYNGHLLEQSLSCDHKNMDHSYKVALYMT